MAAQDRRNLATIEEVAEHFQLSVSTIYALRHKGEGVGALGFMAGKRLRWSWDAIDRFVAEQSAAPVVPRVQRAGRRRPVRRAA